MKWRTYWAQRVRQTINYWTISLQVWWTLRQVGRHFRRVALLPRDEAMVIVTKWRWDLCHAKNVDEEYRKAFLYAVDRLEEIVTGTTKGVNTEEQKHEN